MRAARMPVPPEDRAAPADHDPLLMMRDCAFCRQLHMSPYVDELEETVLDCRDYRQCRGDPVGRLEEWEGRDTVPIPVELAYFQAD